MAFYWVRVWNTSDITCNPMKPKMRADLFTLVIVAGKIFRDAMRRTSGSLATHALDAQMACAYFAASLTPCHVYCNAMRDQCSFGYE
jgi:hypothetical protein